MPNHFSCRVVMSLLVSLLCLSVAAPAVTALQPKRPSPDGGAQRPPGPAPENPNPSEDGSADKPADEKPPEKKKKRKTTQPTSGPTFPALRHSLKDLSGKDVDLMQFKGRVVLIVPVAWDSNRRQFEDLEFCATRLAPMGFAIVPVFVSDFTPTEKRTDTELANAIRLRYSTSFPIYASVAVKGENAHPLFTYLQAEDKEHESGGEIKGAFTKFLIDRNGEVVERWPPETRLNADNAHILNNIVRDYIHGTMRN
jgi:glutathione peroxidase